MKNLKRFWLALTCFFALALTTTQFAQAGNYTLTNNTGSASDVFFITGEATLVMNGFDLQPRGIPRPTSLDRVSIDVVTPIPNVPIEVVVYQDADGGDPVNSTLVGRQTVNINQAGIFSATFDPPLQITAPVVWVGFYLPPDFRFRADTSGTSVLTYWAWTPNSTFDLNNLSSAQVFGPGNGSAPVNLNMGGIARITAELITTATPPADSGTITPGTTGRPGSLTSVSRDSQGRIVQVVGDPNTSLAAMVPYSNTWGCGELYYDLQDIRVNFRSGVAVGCKTSPANYSPAAPEGYRIRNALTYDVTVFGVVSPGTNRMTYPITHCLRVTGSDLNNAVMGIAYGIPHQWEVLPTIRFGDFICADLFYAGPVTYLIPN